MRDVVLVRLEQISPFPHDLLVGGLLRGRCGGLVGAGEGWGLGCAKSILAWRRPRPQGLRRHTTSGQAIQTLGQRARGSPACEGSP